MVIVSTATSIQESGDAQLFTSFSAADDWPMCLGSHEYFVTEPGYFFERRIKGPH